MEQSVQAVKEKTKVGTPVMDRLVLVGSLFQDRMKAKVKMFRVPALAFSFQKMVKHYISALWGGHALPLKVRVDGAVSREIMVGRSLFATTFIIADSVLLVGRFGVWVLKKFPWKVSIWNVVLVSGLAVGFIGWVFPWFLDQMDLMSKIHQTKTMQALNNIDLNISIPEVGLNVGWIMSVPVLGVLTAVPFSVARFKKWRGFKSVLSKKSKTVIGDDDK